MFGKLIFFIHFFYLIFSEYHQKMSDNPKEAEKEMDKAIFISADCWLEVFHLLPRFQLGLGIALISHRFDYYVDEHFKTRKWTFDNLEIRSKIGENGANEMEIVNSKGKALPIPQIPLPNKVMAFRHISIDFCGQNVLTFLRRFHRLFSVCSTEFGIYTANNRISEFVMRNIWPIFKDSIRDMYLDFIVFYQMRHLAPSFLFNFPSLRVVGFNCGVLPEFPPDDSANASDGQAVAKWLFTPRPDNLMKVLRCSVGSAVDQLLATLEQIKVAFSAASSPVAFIILTDFPSSSSLSSVMPFQLTNELTGEKLELSQEDANVFVLIRRPIGGGGWKKWQKEIKKAVERKNNKIEIYIRGDGVDKSLFDSSP